MRSCLTCEVFPTLPTHVSHIIPETTFGSDTISRNQLNQKLKLMVTIEEEADEKENEVSKEKKANQEGIETEE